MPVVPRPDGEGVEGWVVEAGGVNERRTPLPDLVESCPLVVGAVTSGAGDGEALLTDGCVLGVRVDLAGVVVVCDPRPDAPEPDVALDAEPEEPELPEELPLTCACAAATPASSSEMAIE